jgi:hypothetical protein
MRCVSLYFNERLNENRLLRSEEDARFLIDAVREIDAAFGDGSESTALTVYQVYAVA